MNANDLTTKQLDKLFDQLRPLVDFLRRLEDRMVAQNFPPEDELYQAVHAAHDACQKLFVAVHYQACDAIRRKAK